MQPFAQPGGQFAFQFQGRSGVRYVIQNSTNPAAWTSISTNTLAEDTLNFTNPVPAGVARSFWRALWQP